LAAAEAEMQISDTGEFIDPAAGLKVAEPVAADMSEAVDAPVVSETEVESLTQLLTVDPTAVDPEADRRRSDRHGSCPDRGCGGRHSPPSDPADLIGTITETITEGTVRTSAEEFAAAPVAVSEGKKSGLSNLEKAGLLVLLVPLAVGAIIKSNNDRQEERAGSCRTPATGW
jgi:hypothetical protein